jgi:hypothetical protein
MQHAARRDRSSPDARTISGRSRLMQRTVNTWLGSVDWPLQVELGYPARRT